MSVLYRVKNANWHGINCSGVSACTEVPHTNAGSLSVPGTWLIY